MWVRITYNVNYLRIQEAMLKLTNRNCMEKKLREKSDLCPNEDVLFAVTLLFTCLYGKYSHLYKMARDKEKTYSTLICIYSHVSFEKIVHVQW